MKFRIVRYYGYYKPQVLKTNGEYEDIGSSTGYLSVHEAKCYCELYKMHEDSKIVDEFEL